jgi:L-threonylcarbamoyladenylate synthase
MKVIQHIQSEVNNAHINQLKSAVITCDEHKEYYKDTVVMSLGSIKKPDELAYNLFNCLRECDNQAIQIVFAEAFSEDDLGLALMNRLKKAAGFNIIDV